MSTIKKVLFLNPPDPALLKESSSGGYSYFEPPLGLLYVYSYILEHSSVNARFLDLNIDLKFQSLDSMEGALTSILDEFHPDLVALSALYYSGIHVFHRVAKVIKQHASKILVVFGGHYPTHLTERCLDDVNIDYVVLSEGELGLKELIEALNGKKVLSQVEGVAYRENGQLKKQPRVSFRADYCDQKRLPWQDTNFSFYFREGRNVLQRIDDQKKMKLAAITASRGCPNACTFCSSKRFWNRSWRKRNVSYVIEEIQYLIHHYGINTIVFNDENIAVDRKWFHELLDGLQKLKITWISSGGLSIRAINDPETLIKMYASGIGLFNLAVESGYNAMLARVQKPLTVEETEQVIARIREYGDAYIVGFAITGFPFENWQGVQKTLQFMGSLDLDWKSFYCFHPFPGCELAVYCAQHGLMEEFDSDYGDVYFAPKLKYPDYTGEDLSEASYLANLKTNFLLNRNLRLGTEHSLAQAERDFNYVLEMVPDHVFAYLGVARVSLLQGNKSKAEQSLKKARRVLRTSSFAWQIYLDKLNVNLESVFTEG